MDGKPQLQSCSSWHDIGKETSAFVVRFATTTIRIFCLLWLNNWVWQMLAAMRLRLAYNGYAAILCNAAYLSGSCETATPNTLESREC